MTIANLVCSLSGNKDQLFLTLAFSSDIELSQDVESPLECLSIDLQEQNRQYEASDKGRGADVGDR